MSLPLRLEALDADDPVVVEAAFAVVRDCEVAALGSTEETVDSLRANLTGPSAWREQHRLAWSGDELVGVLFAELDADGREIYVDSYAVGPDAISIDRLLLSTGLAAAREHARARSTGLAVPSDPFALTTDLWQVLGGCPVPDVAHAQVLAELGFRPVRCFWRMRWDLAGVDSVAPPPPPGVSRRRADGEADRRAVHRIFNESFAAHFGHTHDSVFEQWIAEIEALHGHDPDQWYLGTLDGDVVAVCLCDDSRADIGSGYVRTLGVVERARGRGIARWLLQCAAADAVTKGRTGLALAVDGENATGATALYESVGFVQTKAVDLWCLPVVD